MTCFSKPITMLRTIIFWTHLTVGLITGTMVFVLCFTGAILAFEVQLVNWCERDARAHPALDGAELLSPAVIAAKATIPAGERIAALEWFADPDMPVRALTDQRTVTLINGYTGDVLGSGAVTLRRFLRWITDVHTNLVSSVMGQWVVSIANAGFVFLILSGLWLWWPRQARWKAFRAAMTPRWHATGKARDWNWHTTLGFWFLVPLLIIASSGLVLSFKAIDTWWRSFGGSQLLSAPVPVEMTTENNAPHVLSWPQWVALIDQRTPGWRSFIIGGNGTPKADGILNCTVNFGSPRHRADLVQLKLDTLDGHIREERRWANEDGPIRARALARLGHTGEIIGTLGQVIGFVACLAGCLLVYTGLSLSWRRFVHPRAVVNKTDANTAAASSPPDVL
jgi:uncharacterized iron-regulated membrane protein